MDTKQNLSVFLDAIGRTIIGKVVSDTEEILAVENPALVHIQINSGNLQLQILPLLFKELCANSTASTVWNYKKSNITTSNPIEFSQQMYNQYSQLFAPPVPKEPQTIKLFDE
jgi:hypothetical protein